MCVLDEGVPNQKKSMRLADSPISMLPCQAVAISTRYPRGVDHVKEGS